MTKMLRRRPAQMLLGSCLSLTLCAAVTAAHPEELKIGFIAPVTGIYAQISKDMVNGFQLYLDQHNGKLGGADVTFIVEDDQGKPDTRRHQGKKVDTAGQSQHDCRWPSGFDWLCTRAN